jgi:hypothetical protein
MHSKKKGNIGQLATGFCLSKLGYSVFTEQGDISKIDLIAEKDGKIIRFQCKAVTPKKDCLGVPLRKCGPGYRIKYTQDMFDYFAVYDLVDKDLYVLPSSILEKHNNTFTLRKKSPKSGQVSGVNLAENYLAEKILQGGI